MCQRYRHHHQYQVHENRDRKDPSDPFNKLQSVPHLFSEKNVTKMSRHLRHKFPPVETCSFALSTAASGYVSPKFSLCPLLPSLLFLDSVYPASGLSKHWNALHDLIVWTRISLLSSPLLSVQDMFKFGSKRDLRSDQNKCSIKLLHDNEILENVEFEVSDPLWMTWHEPDILVLSFVSLSLGISLT